MDETRARTGRPATALGVSALALGAVLLLALDGAFFALLIALVGVVILGMGLATGR